MVDDPDVDAPIRGRAWIAWVGGAVLLVGLVVVLLRILGSDGGEAADSSGGDAGGAGQEPARATGAGEGGGAEGSGTASGVGRLRELVPGATFEVPGTALPTTDLDGALVTYGAARMGDGDPATAWRVPGDATGQTVTITLPRPAVVTRVGIINGYAKQVAGVDWYLNNRRILAATWGFDDGTTVEQTFVQRPAVQRLQVPPVETTALTLTLTAVTPPGTGDLGRDYTAISEVSVTGRRAG
ncbi:NADase-type glycan-binding domain-containing protein [Nocardioides xinjiangensis]|uniref:NADase-type glycan-binding domain-containing protein n=1 Tax=Nocardioides xinjiangensis TaxID=2817376 RepID=UPI001B307BB2|nr:hypothetical protein [Nocardioides sp. SYSU D00514]